MAIAVVTQAVTGTSPSVAATNYPVATTTSASVTIPAAVGVDDILILCCTNRDATADPSVTDNDTGGNAWAKLLSGDNATANASVWWKRATSATASKVITASEFTGSCVAYLSVFSGASTAATPYSNASYETNASNNETHAGFTPGEDNCRIFLCVFNATAQINAATMSTTNPGALTQNGSVRSSGGTDCALDFSSANQTTATATGNLTWTQSNAASMSIVFALLPAAAGGTIFTRTLSDALSVADAPVRGLNAYRQMPQDAIELLDLLARGQTHGRAVTDSLSLLDTLLRSRQRGRTLQHSVAVGDLMSRYSDKIRRLEDAATADDTTQRRIEMFRRLLDPTVDIGDMAVRSINMFRAAGESISITDDVRRSVKLFRNLLETIDARDNLIVTLTLAGVIIVTRVLQDGIDLVDAVQRGAKAYRRAQEDIGVADALGRTAHLTRTLTDVLTLAESMARFLIMSRIVADTASAADVAVRYALLNRLQADDLAVTESFASSITYYETLVGYVLMSLRPDPVVMAIGDSDVAISFVRSEPINMDMRRV